MFKRRIRKYKSTSPKTHLFRWIFLGVVVLILGLGVWIGTTVFRFVGNVTADSGKSTISQLLNFSNKLQGEDAGRTNVLLLGKGGDKHPGGELTDTMEVLSIDWSTNKVALIALPRDFWVKMPNGNYSKINAVNFYGEKGDPKNSAAGAAMASQVVSQVLGIPVHYYLVLDFAGFKQIVDKLGGVDVNVTRAIYDPLYPAADMIHYDPFSISVGPHHLDGATALKYARSRETTSDFDRARRQQEIMSAVKQKLLSSSTLANPVKITDLLNVVGSHIHTNMTVGEIKSFWNKTQGIDMSSSINYVFDTAPTSPLTDLTDQRGYIIFPKKGIGNYQDVQAIAQNIFKLTPEQTKQNYALSPEAKAEMKPKTVTTAAPVAKPRVEFLNAGADGENYRKEVENLKNEGYNLVVTGDANDTYRQSVVYLCGNSRSGSDKTAASLAGLLGASVKNKADCLGYDIQAIAGQNL